MRKFFTLIALMVFGHLGNLNAQVFEVGTCDNGTANTYGPMYSTSTANATGRFAYIYPASQLSGIAGFPITNVYFERTTTTGTMAGTPNFKIYLKEVSSFDWGAGSLDWATAISGATLVYDGDPASIVGSTAGYKNFPLTSNFNYSGTQNLAVLTEYRNTTASTSISWGYDFSAPCIDVANLNTTKYSTNTTGTLATSLATSQIRRPHIGFDLLLTCFPPTAITASNPTLTSSVISWVAPAAPPSQGYDYFYSSTGATPTAGTTPSGSTGAGVTTATIGSLASGTTYTVWVRSNCGGGDLSPWSAAGIFFTLPTNDDCANAIPLTQSATCINTAGTTAGATLSMANTPCVGNPDDDVWFSFVATQTDAQIAISSATAVTGTSVDTYFQVLSGSCGALTSMMCSDPLSGNVGGLTVGETYYIRVYTYAATSTINFNICVNELAVAPTTCGTLSSPAASAAVSLTPTLTWSSVTNASAYEIYIGAVNPPTTLYATVYNNTTTSYTVNPALTPGDYYWYVKAVNSLGSTAPACTPRMFTVVQPPANDDCATATALTVNTDLSCTAVTNGTTVGATESLAACAGSGADDDVWFSFVATSSAHKIKIANVVAATGTSVDIVHQIFSGSCGTLTSLYCTDSPDSTIAYNLTPGNTYYVRVFTYFTTSKVTFNICATTVPPPPANDDCASAIAITTEPANTTCVANVAAITTGATPSTITETSCTTTSDNDDIFYTFTATGTSQALLFSNMVATAGTATALGYHIYSGNCGGLTQLTSCSTTFGSAGTGSAIITGLTPGQVYYLQLFTAGTSNSATFNFCLQDVVPPPANDECSTAISITTQPFGSTCSVPVSGSTTGATPSTAPETSCSTTSDNDDVFYSFTATAKSQILRFSNLVATFGTATALGYHIYSGTCAGLTQLTSCDATFGSAGAGSIQINGLTIGQLYYLKLFAAGTNNTANFDFCLQDAPAPANDECAGATVMPVTTYGSPCTYTAVNTTGATISTTTGQANSCTSTGIDDDLFYTFTSTIAGPYVFSYTGLTATTGTASTVGQNIYTGTCGALAIVTSACSSGYGTGGSGSITVTLAAATTYTIRLWVGSSPNTGAFNFCITAPAPPPVNDECAGAITVVTQPYNATCVTSTSATTLGATASVITETSCSTSNDNDDIFYSFTATGTSQILNFSNMAAILGTATQLGYQVFTGACPGTQLTSCSTGFGTAGAGSTVITGLSVGTLYTLRLFTGGTGNTAAFNFCLQDLPPVPANDECANATVITGGIPVIGNTLSATQSLPPEICGTATGSSAVDVWYQFTATTSGSAIITVNNVATALDAVIQVYSGTCGAFTVIGCADGPAGGGTESVTLNGLVGGQTYYFRVYGYNAGAGSFTVTVSGGAVPITLEYFTGTKQNNGTSHLLQWKVNCSNTASATMILERSANQVNFEPVNNINAPASRCLQPFSYVDGRPLAGTNYYRLKFIDSEGKVTYSNIIAILNKARGIEIVSMMPNPVNAITVLNVSSANVSKMQLVVTDIAGRQLESRSVSLIAGSNQVSMNFAKLASGVYYLTGASEDGEKMTIKFVKE